MLAFETWFAKVSRDAGFDLQFFVKVAAFELLIVNPPFWQSSFKPNDGEQLLIQESHSGGLKKFGLEVASTA